MAYLLGLDIGTTNTKGLLLDERGNQVSSASAPSQVLPGASSERAEFDPHALYEGALQVIRELVGAVKRPSEIRGLCISSMGETGAPLDAHGEVVYPAIAWYDLRTQAQAEWVRRQIGARELYRLTGLPVSTSYGMLKLAWLRENQPDAFRRIRRWLPIGDYVAYRLTGQQVTERTQAWRTMVYELAAADWSASLLGALDFPGELLPEVLLSGTAIGPLLPEVARLTGLPPDCLAVTGGMDAVCAMVGVGALEPGAALDIAGTSEIIITTLEQARASDAMMAASLDVGPHPVDGRYLAFGSMTASGSIVDWAAGLLAPTSGDEVRLETLRALSREAEGALLAGLEAPLILPHFRGSRTPHSDPRSRALVMGLELTTTRGALFLGLLEGLSFESRAVLDALEAHCTTRLEQIWVAGGATRNRLWMALKANVFARPLHISQSPELSARGAAVLAATGVGLYPNLAEATRLMPATRELVPVEPAAAQRYQAKYQEQYQTLYPLFRKPGNAA